MTDNYYVIESGQVLDLIKQHISERHAAVKEAHQLMKELGVETAGYYDDIFDGKLVALNVEEKPNKEFNKPKRRNGGWYCSPKAGTEWHTRFKQQKGYDKRCVRLSEHLKLPTGYSFADETGKTVACGTLASRIIQNCGFLYLSNNGPFAMWVENLTERLEKLKKQYPDLTLSEPSEPISMEFEGCRPILKEEWDLMVAQHNVEIAKQKA